MKRIAIIGSTGSIGKSALEVIEHLGPEYRVAALAARGNIDLIEAQARRFKPELVALFEEEKAKELKRRLPSFKVVSGLEGVCEVASHPSADLTLSSMTGTLGLVPTLAALKAKKTLALANKEALVSGGELVMNEARRQGVSILPVDSEHSALFQCLVGEKTSEVRRLVLTASGGPFRNYSHDQLEKVSAKEALAHPTWSMGPKVSCDSSTLMNKGLEMIEAHFLFGLPPSQIEVIVHPQSVIHSLVEFCDGSMKAQMSAPDMKMPIQYAFTYPNRMPGLLKPFDFIRVEKLEFYRADQEKFRCLSLAYRALQQGGTMACYMNAANEVLVGRFLQGSLRWCEIATCLERLMDRHKVEEVSSLETVLETDRMARAQAEEI